MSTEYCLSWACARPERATSIGSPTPLPGSGAHTGTPARSPTTWSWVTALGRWRSAATRSGVWPWSLSHLASFPASVVLPAPWRPASMMTVGGRLAKLRSRAWPPRISTSSALTILTTCWPGLRALETSAPLARSRTAAVNSRTTGSATSASRRARRISETVVLMSCSDSRPLPRRLRKVAVRRSERLANKDVSSCSMGRSVSQGIRPGGQSAGHRLPDRELLADPAPLRGVRDVDVAAPAVDPVALPQGPQPRDDDALAVVGPLAAEGELQDVDVPPLTGEGEAPLVGAGEGAEDLRVHDVARVGRRGEQDAPARPLLRGRGRAPQPAPGEPEDEHATRDHATHTASRQELYSRRIRGVLAARVQFLTDYRAAAARSPVRTRMTSSTAVTHTFPSPIRPVCAAWTRAAETTVTSESETRTSTRIFGTRSTAYSAPR